jgi:hypothetical protein
MKKILMTKYHFCALFRIVEDGIFIDEKPPFYGCGECGRTWISKESLDEGILKICETFTYRKAAYEKDKGTWLAVPYKNLPSNLMDQIEKEPSPFKSKKISK